MSHRLAIPLLWTVIVLPTTVAAQPTFAWSPAGAHLIGGGLGNGIPFWSSSATYQQVHDYADMLQLGGGKPIIIRGMAFRPAKTTTWNGRSIEVQVNMGGTSVTSQTISTTFSTNLGSNPVRVVGNSQTPFQKFNFPSFTGTGDPNPPGIIVPFKTTWIWLNTKNNSLCWEWRHKNASSNQAGTLDAVNGIAPGGVTRANVGRGCTPSGSTTPARASISMLGAFTGSRLNVSLLGATANARALMMVGIKRQHTVLPGWCSNLELVPAVHLYGQTTLVGTWTFQPPMTSFRGVPTFELLVQYAFADKSQPGGVGLSDMAVYQTPLGGTWHVSRVYHPRSPGTASGNETATKGNTSVNLGLVTGFQIK
ncbi:MAG: hypothetical protein ACYTGW_07335 [Planctomycetota bacterium]|jgi:hypothetical protein